MPAEANGNRWEEMSFIEKKPPRKKTENKNLRLLVIQDKTIFFFFRNVFSMIHEPADDEHMLGCLNGPLATFVFWLSEMHPKTKQKGLNLRVYINNSKKTAKAREVLKYYKFQCLDRYVEKKPDKSNTYDSEALKIFRAFQ